MIIFTDDTHTHTRTHAHTQAHTHTWASSVVVEVLDDHGVLVNDAELPTDSMVDCG